MSCNKLKWKSITLKLSNKIRIFILFAISFLYLLCFNEYIFADDAIVYTDEIYKLAETNGIAKSICNAIEIGKILMIPLFAIMFSILGLSAYQGNVKWSTFITFALGIAAFKAAGAIAEFFMPEMGLQYGCKCAIERQIRDTNGVVKRYATGLNYDCSEGTEDYEEEYGASINSEEVTQEVIQSIEKEVKSLEETITALQNTLTTQQNLVNEYEKNEIIQNYLLLKSEFATKENNKNNAAAEKQTAYTDLMLYKSFLPKNQTAVRKANEVLNEVTAERDKAKNTLDEYLQTTNVSTGIKTQLENQLADANKRVKEAQKVLTDAQKVLTDNESQINTQNEIYQQKISLYNKISDEYKDILSQLTEKEKENTIQVYLYNVSTLQNMQDQINETQGKLDELKNKLNA